MKSRWNATSIPSFLPHFADEGTAISVGFKAPDFALVGIDNRKYSIQELKGKVVFLEFWSIACSFCKQILPQVNQLVAKNSAADFVALQQLRLHRTHSLGEHDVRHYLR